ncbi:MAG TPA: hypothetical protein VEX64_07485, partial [Pyrinomonadaceae bacterium]|nr:hypothetical protein [Pyrinomonadaceae bacterium]
MKLRVVLFVALLFLLLPVFVSAKDVWTSVSSRNFHLIGDAAESEIKQVAVKLEQFREIFRQIYPKAKLDSRIPTRILVFKNRDSYKPFKPIRADGEIDDLITGHFQAGEDVNYIAFSGVNDLAGTDSTLFHEYTHFVINNTYGRTNIPLWLEEGFAAYYQTLRMENNGKAIVGKLSPVYLQILQEEPLIPFETFLSIDNQSLHLQADSRTRNIFYVQSSALLHYLQQGDKNRHRNG